MIALCFSIYKIRSRDSTLTVKSKTQIDNVRSHMKIEEKLDRNLNTGTGIGVSTHTACTGRLRLLVELQGLMLRLLMEPNKSYRRLAYYLRPYTFHVRAFAPSTVPNVRRWFERHSYTGERDRH